MKTKLLILVALLATSFVYSDMNIAIEEPEHDNSWFFYVNSENFLNLNSKYCNVFFSPLIGIGSRKVFGKNGIDWNFQTELYALIKSKATAFEYAVNASYLRFFKSERSSKYYVGVGYSFMSMSNSDYKFTLKSPSFIVGKQIYDKARTYIIELRTNYPNYLNIFSKSCDYGYLPRNERQKRLKAVRVSLTTGFGF